MTDPELWIFITAGCLFSCCVGSAVTYYAVNWSRDRQEEADQQRRENAIEHALELAQENQQLEQRVSGDTPAVGGTVELFDGARLAEWREQAEPVTSFPPPEEPLSDQEWVEYADFLGIDRGVDQPTDPCPSCNTELTTLDDGSRWCPACTKFWDRPNADCPEAGGCRRPEQCTTGCHWRRLDTLNRGLTDTPGLRD